MSENLSQLLSNMFEIENISNRKSKHLNELKHDYLKKEFEVKNIVRNQQTLKIKETQLLAYLAEIEIDKNLFDEKILFFDKQNAIKLEEKQKIEEKIRELKQFDNKKAEEFDKVYFEFSNKFSYAIDLKAELEESKRSYMTKMIEAEFLAKNEIKILENLDRKNAELQDLNKKFAIISSEHNHLKDHIKSSSINVDDNHEVMRLESDIKKLDEENNEIELIRLSEKLKLMHKCIYKMKICKT